MTDVRAESGIRSDRDCTGLGRLSWAISLTFKQERAEVGEVEMVDVREETEDIDDIDR